MDTSMDIIEEENSNVTDMEVLSMSISESSSWSYEDLERIVMHIPEGRSSQLIQEGSHSSTQHGTSSMSGLDSKEKDRFKSLEEDSFYARQLEFDANQYPLKKDSECECGVRCHPRSWTRDRIELVHRNSSLLNLDLSEENKIANEFVTAYYEDETSVICEVPMTEGHFLKKKTEDVIRYTDIEAQNVDLKITDFFAYKQPSTRKIFILVANNRVEGIVVAEPVVEAFRLAHADKKGYQELEEEVVAVRVGINRIWVHVSRRRAKWATILCDIVRSNFFPGETLKLSDIAFNIGPDSVLSFGMKYTGNDKVPLYEGIQGRRAINMLESPSP